MPMSLKHKLWGPPGASFYSHDTKGPGSQTKGCDIPEFPCTGTRGRQAAQMGYTSKIPSFK